MRDRVVALDCEMVGIGLNGKVSALARCSLIDFEGNVLFDEFVQPKGHVTDLRTKWSGIRKRDISSRKAVTLEDCQAEMARLLKGKVLVGHALRNDLTALLLSHPKAMIRDTARYRPYMRVSGSANTEGSLPLLTVLPPTATRKQIPSAGAARANQTVFEQDDSAGRARLGGRRPVRARSLQAAHGAMGGRAARAEEGAHGPQSFQVC